MLLQTDLLLCTALFLGQCHGLYDRQLRMNRPHVETYWESWEDGLDNFASNLADVPVAPIGAKSGVNIVNLAFADHRVKSDNNCTEDVPCITNGLEMRDPQKLRDAVKKIHNAGGFVKIAFGGATYGNPYADSQDLWYLVRRISDLVQNFNLDGVDITAVQDCGAWWGLCGWEDGQIELISELRRLMPYKIISYTFPNLPSVTFEKVIMNSIDNLDYVMSSYGYNTTGNLATLGVPNHKIVLGSILTRGRSPYNDCDMNMVIDYAETVLQGGFGGVMTWSINSDTRQRGDYEAGVCNQYQTGRADASAVDTISYILNSS